MSQRFLGEAGTARLASYIQSNSDNIDELSTQIGNILPKVTTSDNGAFLRVVNGIWTKAIIANAEEVSF